MQDICFSSQIICSQDADNQDEYFSLPKGKSACSTTKVKDVFNCTNSTHTNNVQCTDNSTTKWMSIIISGKEIMFSEVIVSLSFCLFVCLLATLFKNLWEDCNEFHGGVLDGERDKWLSFGGNPDHDPAVMKVYSLWVLGIWWLSLDIWLQRSVTEWLTLQIVIPGIWS